MIRYVPKIREIICDCCGSVVGKQKHKYFGIFSKVEHEKVTSFLEIKEKSEWGNKTKHICGMCQLEILKKIKERQERLRK